MFSLRRLIAAEMGRIHSIQPKCGLPVEPLLWTKMSHFLTLVQSCSNSSPAEQRCTKRYNSWQDYPNVLISHNSHLNASCSLICPTTASHSWPQHQSKWGLLALLKSTSAVALLNQTRFFTIKWILENWFVVSYVFNQQTGVCLAKEWLVDDMTRHLKPQQLFQS